MLPFTVVIAETEAISPTPISIVRVNSTFSELNPSCTKLRYRMNCYGYALQVYAYSLNSFEYYLQQPGEFADDNQSFSSLKNQIEDYLDSGDYTASEVLSFFSGKITDDFNTLHSQGNEWTIQPSSATASIPSGYRKIALTIGLSQDFHFYLRHSNGTWSHKIGTSLPTNYSIDTHVQITDSNISSVISEGGYDDGSLYFVIKKSAVSDYPHLYGHNNNTLKTGTKFRDKAGDSITKAFNLYSASTKSSILDYTDDIDWFAFKPITSGSYTFSTSQESVSVDINMTLYDRYGDYLASDNGSGSPSITINLNANTLYFIRVSDANHHYGSYTLNCVSN